ncbi:hypothetical protein B566_EDAN006233 [Ephemera danica]|nr:hypothetical protein B566_EDAN006233 [Ephemera danica]
MRIGSQLTANALVFTCVNVVGVFVHNLMEHAQRKAFLDTRNCIAARLEMEDENEKLFYRRTKDQGNIVSQTLELHFLFLQVKLCPFFRDLQV